MSMLWLTVQIHRPYKSPTWLPSRQRFASRHGFPLERAEWSSHAARSSCWPATECLSPGLDDYGPSVELSVVSNGWIWFKMHNWLVVWNMTFIFPYIGNVIIPTNSHIFQRGRYTTNPIMLAKEGHFYHPWFPGNGKHTTSMFMLIFFLFIPWRSGKSWHKKKKLVGRDDDHVSIYQ